MADLVAKTDVDEAYIILKKKGAGIYYKDLITQVIENRNIPVRSLSATISEIYTQINMDSRFHYAGEGVWDLVEWLPPEVKRHSRSSGEGKSSSSASKRKENLFESIQE